MASEISGIRDTVSRGGQLAKRIRELAYAQGIGVGDRPGGRVERVGAARGLVFPGVIATPPAASTETQREERDRTAIMEASRWETDPYTL